MNREQKAERVAAIAAAIKESEAVFAVDYRGISVPQAAELRTRLLEAGSRFSVVKNTLTERAVDEAGSASLKDLLEGPTAFTFVPADGGDVALAAKALSQFRRANEVLEFKGGVMNGEPLTIDQIESIARLPGQDVLQSQLVGVLASPITGLVRGLNQLIAGLAIALGQIQAEGKVGAGSAETEPPPPEDGPDAGEEPAQETSAEEPAQEAPAEEPAQEAPAEEQSEAPAEEQSEAPGDPVAEAEAAEAETETPTETETEDAPSEGEEKEG